MKRLLMLFLLIPFMLTAAELAPIGWGVVVVPSTTLYDKTGKPTCDLFGGELFNVLREVKMDKAPAYYISVTRKGVEAKGIISAAESRFFASAIPVAGAAGYDEFKADQDFCAEYYSRCATRDALVERKREQHLAKSPAKNLPKLKKELAGIPALDRKYEVAQKAAKTDGQRIKYRDLRKELRYQASGLQQEIKRLEGIAETWEAEHPFDDSSVKKTAVWKRLNAQLEPYAERLEALNAKYPNSLPKK